ncbi:MAG: hypothetical protein U0798_15245 [Gemmataceae bacterium]
MPLPSETDRTPPISEAEPITLDELAQRGLMIVGNRIVRAVCFDELGYRQSIMLPNPQESTDELKAEHKTLTQKILDFIIRRPRPVKRRLLATAINGGNDKGRFGQVLTQLVKSRQIIRIDGYYADQIEKFDRPE